MKTYTEEDLRLAFQSEMERGAFEQAGNYFDAPLDENEYIESLNAPKEEKEIPITYGLIKATCGWSKFAEVTDRNVYAIFEFGDYKDNEVFYITESQAEQLKFI